MHGLFLIRLIKSASHVWENSMPGHCSMGPCWLTWPISTPPTAAIVKIAVPIIPYSLPSARPSMLPSLQLCWSFFQHIPWLLGEYFLVTPSSSTELMTETPTTIPVVAAWTNLQRLSSSPTMYHSIFLATGPSFCLWWILVSPPQSPMTNSHQLTHYLFFLCAMSIDLAILLGPMGHTLGLVIRWNTDSQIYSITLQDHNVSDCQLIIFNVARPLMNH